MHCAVRRRTVCTEYENGDRLFSEGKAGFERGIRFEFSNGDKLFYDGTKGLERLKRIEWADGDVTHVEDSPRGEEQEQTQPREKGTLSEAGGTRGSTAANPSSRSPNKGQVSHAHISSYGVVLLGSARGLSSSKPADQAGVGTGASSARTATASALPALSVPRAAASARLGAISNRTSVTRSHRTFPGLLSATLAQARALEPFKDDNTKRGGAGFLGA